MSKQNSTLVKQFNLLSKLLLRDYQQKRAPDYSGIIAAMLSDGMVKNVDDIENDHFAFRTFGLQSVGIAALEKVFLHFGYEKRERFDFVEKKLTAHWYSPPKDSMPRVFISEIKVHELSPKAQQLIESYVTKGKIDSLKPADLDSVEKLESYFHQRPWPQPSWADFQALINESEYAAWVLYHANALNHLTVAVHGLPDPFDQLDNFNAFLEKHGFALNDAGGKIKVSPDGKLLQSSTVARMIPREFSDGKGGAEKHEIAGSYIEFAERKILDQFKKLPKNQLKREHRREGFEVASADKIYESTYRAQTQK